MAGAGIDPGRHRAYGARSRSPAYRPQSGRGNTPRFDDGGATEKLRGVRQAGVCLRLRRVEPEPAADHGREMQIERLPPVFPVEEPVDQPVNSGVSAVETPRETWAESVRRPVAAQLGDEGPCSHRAGGDTVPLAGDQGWPADVRPHGSRPGREVYSCL